MTLRFPLDTSFPPRSHAEPQSSENTRLFKTDHQACEQMKSNTIKFLRKTSSERRNCWSRIKSFTGLPENLHSVTPCRGHDSVVEHAGQVDVRDRAKTRPWACSASLRPHGLSRIRSQAREGPRKDLPISLDVEVSNLQDSESASKA